MKKIIPIEANTYHPHQNVQQSPGVFELPSHGHHTRPPMPPDLIQKDQCLQQLERFHHLSCLQC
jgi:hypothetical protein